MRVRRLCQAHRAPSATCPAMAVWSAHTPLSSAGSTGDIGSGGPAAPAVAEHPEL